MMADSPSNPPSSLPPGSAGATALVLSGGGARAAYQAGVLRAIAELLPDARRNPFPIICGTSAGAINAAGLACGAENFRGAVQRLVGVWEAMEVSRVYRGDALGVGIAGARWLSALAFGWLLRRNPRSLLDNGPLRELLAGELDFHGIDRAVGSGALQALCITASGYNSGQSVSFYQGLAHIDPWERAQRVGARARLTVEHLMASCAIPFIFPAVKLNREWFGDGSMRQLAPIAPAIHLGAERILVVAAGRLGQERQARGGGEGYPSLAQVAGHALSSIFLDGLAVDIERLTRINRTLSVIPPEVRQASGLALRPIQTLVLSPSERLDHLAARHARSLPWPVKTLLSGIGALRRNGGALTSYLLFQADYTQALMDLGYRDTLARGDEVRAFLDLG